jgi:hypothetical protein
MPNLEMLFIPQLNCICKIYKDAKGKYVKLHNRKEYLVPLTIQENIKQLEEQLADVNCSEDYQAYIRKQLMQLKTMSAKGQTALTQFSRSQKQ